MNKEAMKLALDFAIMHHTDAGYTEVRYAVQAALREALAEQPAKDEFKAAYIEAMVASNEAGFAGMSAAETIRELSRMVAEQPAQPQEPVAWGKPTDEMVQAATDEYDEWANENKGTTECIRAMLSKALKASPPAQPQPFEIEWPEYNEHAMGCGLEDIDVYCRYRAMRYGWDCAIEAVKQAIPDSIYTSPPAQRVGLTNKKIDSIQQEWIAKGMSGSRSFARAIEAAHGIKENT